MRNGVAPYKLNPTPSAAVQRHMEFAKREQSGGTGSVLIPAAKAAKGFYSVTVEIWIPQRHHIASCKKLNFASYTANGSQNDRTLPSALSRLKSNLTNFSQDPTEVNSPHMLPEHQQGAF